jgi:hypothetical protein
MLKGLMGWNNQVKSARIKANDINKAMTPKQEQALKVHLKAIAEILYSDCHRPRNTGELSKQCSVDKNYPQ